jgi:hypothetical protein
MGSLQLPWIENASFDAPALCAIVRTVSRAANVHPGMDLMRQPPCERILTIEARIGSQAEWQYALCAPRVFRSRKGHHSEPHGLQLFAQALAYEGAAEAASNLREFIIKVGAIEAELKAEGEHEVYRRRQDAEYRTGFDRVVDETRWLRGEEAPKAPETKPRRGRRRKWDA